MLIVCAHTIPSLDWAQHPVLERFLDGIANESSIFFFFIAGYLFQHLSGRFHYPSYLKQKLKTVIVPYLLLSIPSIVLFTGFAEREGMWSWFYTLPVWQQVLMFLVTGKHLAPLWFVPTITLFYLVAPLLVAMDRKKPQLYWIIVPLLGLSIYLGRDGPHGPLDKALYLLPMYLLGMAFCHFQSHAEALARRLWLPLLAVTLFGLTAHTLNWAEPPYYLMIMKAAMAPLMTLALLRWHGVFGNKLDYIAHVSFGIFFVHAYFIAIVRSLTTWWLNGHHQLNQTALKLPGTLPVFFAYVAVVLAASVAIIWLAQKLFGRHSRMVIGA